MADMDFIKYCSSRIGKLFILNRDYVFYDPAGEYGGVLKPGTAFVLCKVNAHDWYQDGELVLGVLTGDKLRVLNLNYKLKDWTSPFDEAV